MTASISFWTDAGTTVLHGQVVWRADRRHLVLCRHHRRQFLAKPVLHGRDVGTAVGPHRSQARYLVWPDGHAHLVGALCASLCFPLSVRQADWGGGGN